MKHGNGSDSPPDAPASAESVRRGWVGWAWLLRGLLACLAVGVLVVAANMAWWVLLRQTPKPIRPPAGQAIEGQAPFRFAFTGDTRCHMAVLEAIFASIRAQRDVRFILYGGDFVRHSNKHSDKIYFDYGLHGLHAANLSVPFCPVPGNHDVAKGVADVQARTKLYRAAFGPRQYWFAYANSLFVAFDDSAGRFESDDLRWLDRTLEQHRGKYVSCFVFMHIPPRDPRPERDQALRPGAEAFMKILARRRVTALLVSHIHGYYEYRLDGIPVYVSGGAGARLVQPGARYHYLLCTVLADGAFKVEKKDVTNWSANQLDCLWRMQIPKLYHWSAGG